MLGNSKYDETIFNLWYLAHFVYGIKCYEFKQFLYILYSVETQYGEFSYGHQTEEADTNIQYLKHLTRL
jgi:hypothetical protein